MSSGSSPKPKQQPNLLWQIMPAQQWMKFCGWLVFAVLIPLAPFAYVWIMTTFLNHPGSVATLAARGDLLFMAILLLAMSLNWSFLSFLETPKTRADQQLYNYLEASFSVFFLIILCLVYGTLIFTESLYSSKVETIWFSVTSLLFVVALSGFKYLNFLRQGRI